MGTQKITTVQTTTTTTAAKPSRQSSNVSGKKQGFSLGVNATHEFADWGFKMKNAGSYLHYDDLRWNVFSADGVYYFGNSIPMQISVGAKYGMQFGDSPMVDDDISAEKLWTAEYVEVSGVGTEVVLFGSPAMSVGTSSGGKQMGFNAAFGLTDVFSVGRMKITPSVGYRYFKYELETKNNYGLMVDVVNSDTFVNCVEVSGGEIQCSPYVGFANDLGVVGGFAGFATDSSGNILLNPNGSYVIYNDTTANQLDLGDTYYYEQKGVSHKYTTEWAGPYVALDMNYEINDNNSVVAGVEFGLPVYDSKGDQPYRIDWAHPTSVEDKGEFGDAYHVGFNAAWTTKITNSVGFTLGLTYDYYKVSGATATTYINKSYYEDIVDSIDSYIDYLVDQGAAADVIAAYQSSLNDAQDVVDYYSSMGWKAESHSEIESIYKSMGIRAGLEIKF